MLTQILDGKTYEDVNGDRYKAMNNMKNQRCLDTAQESAFGLG